jgi:hypothetical protein
MTVFVTVKSNVTPDKQLVITTECEHSGQSKEQYLQGNETISFYLHDDSTLTMKEVLK